MLIDPVEVSQAQQTAFESLIGQNARPIQPRNDRVLRFGY
jgi:carbonic anhydrase